METPAFGWQVDAYRNLNKACISVKSRESKNYGTVIAHVDSLVVCDVEFVVQPAGRQRVRETERKNVHAFVRGTWVDHDVTKTAETTAITYNPYQYESFVTRETEQAVAGAEYARITPEGVDAVGIELE